MQFYINDLLSVFLFALLLLECTSRPECMTKQLVSFMTPFLKNKLSLIQTVEYQM